MNTPSSQRVLEFHFAADGADPVLRKVVRRTGEKKEAEKEPPFGVSRSSLTQRAFCICLLLAKHKEGNKLGEADLVEIASSSLPDTWVKTLSQGLESREALPGWWREIRDCVGCTFILCQRVRKKEQECNVVTYQANVQPLDQLKLYYADDQQSKEIEGDALLELASRLEAGHWKNRLVPRPRRDSKEGGSARRNTGRQHHSQGPITPQGIGSGPADGSGNVSVAAGRDINIQKEIHVHMPQPTIRHPGSAPSLPSLIIGREEALRDLKARLGIPSGERSLMQVLTAVRGWPGVGKTTLAAALAHDRDIAATFPDGVLWTSLGQKPDVLSELATWGRAVGTDDLLRCRDLPEATKRLAGLLWNKRILLIVDDAWEVVHVLPFQVGGAGCAMLVTTRVNSVAQAIAPTPADVYKLAVLTDEKALELLKRLAPAVVAQHPKESLELVRELEGLPLAIQVAGRLLHVEASYGFGVRDLLAELRAGARLLEATAPADRADLAKETTPTVAALLQKSTDRLDPQTRDRFAYLAAFPHKPATFDLRAMKAVWKIEDPKPTVRILVDRGLLEFVEETGRYQMHALLVLHARSLCSRE